MPRRSVRVTLLNNTPSKLTLVGKNLCGGEWTSDQWKPPAEIQPQTQEGWQSESGGIATGTEGWVKYMIGNTDVDFLSGNLCRPELVYIHWDNPFIWADDTKPIDPQVSTSDVAVPSGCEEEKGDGSTFTVLQGGTSSQNCRHELFVASLISSGDAGLNAEWRNWWVALPLTTEIVASALIANTLIGNQDVKLEITLGLRQVGSVGQTLHSLYDGRKGLRAVASEAGKSSLRQLFNM